MIEGRAEHPLAEPFDTDEVGEEHVREHERDRAVDRPSDRAPGRQLRALEPALDRAEHELEVHGLRTSPTAPDAAEQRGDEEDRDDDRQPEQHEDEAIGRPEHGAEHRELAGDEIEQQRRTPADRDERQGHEQRDQPVADDLAPAQEPAAREARVQPAARAVLVQRRQDAFGKRRHGACANGWMRWPSRILPGRFLPRSVITYATTSAIARGWSCSLHASMAVPATPRRTVPKMSIRLSP